MIDNQFTFKEVVLSQKNQSDISQNKSVSVKEESLKSLISKKYYKKDLRVIKVCQLLRGFQLVPLTE